MCEKYNIDDKIRFLVLYFDAHMNVNEISKILNRHTRTVGRWELITKNGGDIRIRKEGQGRKKEITPETENRIVQMVKENPEGASVPKLAARSGISSTSICKILAKKGFKYLGYEEKSTIYDEEERMLRVDFCNKMLFDEGKLIYQTFFSDEMGIELNKSGPHQRKAWQIPTEKVRRKNITENVKLECWGAISAQGATSLDIYKRNMNGDLYREVIKRHRAEMENLYADGDFYFLQDNHPSHRMNEDWVVKKQGLKLLKLPRRSPDLNIIENLWGALKERVTNDLPINEKELRASLFRNWEILTNQERLQPFFEALHRRYIECVAKEGHKLRT